MEYLGPHIETILADTFFKKKEPERLPQSVVDLATKEGIYDYDSPDSVLFSTIATEYGIDPHSLLTYTFDELSYLMNALQFRYLNEEQKKELQRLKKVHQFQKNRKEIDDDISILDDYFANNF
jgi:hypothetical protein